MSAKTILIVDDLHTSRHLLRILLERQGFAVEEARDGQEALQRMNESPPDLVLLDLMMPTMSGDQVLRCIESDATLQDIPIIVLSALADRRQVAKYTKMGGIDYLLKPFTSATLLKRVHCALEKKGLAFCQPAQGVGG